MIKETFFEVMVGQKIGKLTILGTAPSLGKGTRYHCICDCGAEKIIKRNQLVTGQTRSCGCLKGRWIRNGDKHEP